MPQPWEDDAYVDRLLESIMAQESAGNPAAIGVPTDPEGPHGGARAGGGYQMMPGTAREVIQRGDGDLGLRYGNLVSMDDETITNALAAEPELARELARANVKHLLQREGGDPRRVAESWIAGAPGRTGLKPDAAKHRDDYLARWDKEQAPKFASQSFPVNAAASRPHPGFAGQPGPSPAPLPAPPPPGTPGVGVGAVQTVQMPGGRDVQTTAPGGDPVTIYKGGLPIPFMGGTPELSKPEGGVPVAESPAPGAPMKPVDPAAVTPAATKPPAIDPTKGVKPPAPSYQPSVEQGPPAPRREDVLRQLLDELRENPEREIDMDRHWSSLSGAQKAGWIVASTLGGFNEGFRGVPNRAIEALEARRTGDIRSQEQAAALDVSKRGDTMRSIEAELALLGKSAGGPNFQNMPASVAEKGVLVSELRHAANRLAKSYSGLATGQGLASKSPFFASAGSQYDADRAAYIAQVVLMLSGKQSNEREQARLEAMIPTAFWPPTKERGEQLWQASMQWIEDQRKALDDASIRLYGVPATSLDPDVHEQLSAALLPDEIPGFVAEADGDVEP